MMQKIRTSRALPSGARMHPLAALAASILLVFGACSGSPSDVVNTASTEADNDVEITASAEAEDDVVDTESAETCDDEEIGYEAIATCKHPGIDVDDPTNLDDLPTGEAYVVPMELSVEGALEKSLVEDVVQQHLQEVQQCYNQQLQRNPDLAGEVIAEWVIAPSGGVVSASIGKSELDNQRVERCLTSRIQRWTFPKPDDDGVVQVQYAFDFEVR